MPPRPYKFFNLYCRLIFREYSRKTVYIYTNNLMSLLSFRTYRGVRVCVCLYCFASLQNSVHTRLMHPCIACPSRRPDYLHFHKHRQPVLSLAPHYPKSKSTASGGHHNYSSFIIHYSLNKKSAPFQTTDLDIKFQCKIKVCRPPFT